MAGIGNEWHSDDAFGVRVVEGWSDPGAPGVFVASFGTRTFDLACALCECDRVVLVDAAELGKPAGSLDLSRVKAQSSASSSGAAAAHARSPLAAFDLAQQLGEAPNVLWLLGCQPLCLEPGTQLSLPVRDAVAHARVLLREFLEKPCTS